MKLHMKVAEMSLPNGIAGGSSLEIVWGSLNIGRCSQKEEPDAVVQASGDDAPEGLPMELIWAPD